MTQPQAAIVVAAIVNAGFRADARPRPDGSWTVRAAAGDFTVDVGQAHQLATTQGVVGKIAEIEYS